MTDQPADEEAIVSLTTYRQLDERFRIAAAEIVALRARVVEAEEYVARYDAVMETMSIDFEDMFPDWSASDD